MLLGREVTPVVAQGRRPSGDPIGKPQSVSIPPGSASQGPMGTGTAWSPVMDGPVDGS